MTLHENATNERSSNFYCEILVEMSLGLGFIGKGRRDRVSRPTVINFLLCTQQFKIQ